MRIVVPMRELALHGHNVEVIHKIDDDLFRKIRDEASDFDVIVAERLDDYGGIGGWRKARKPGNRLVYECDDDVFAITKENWQAFDHFGKADVREATRAYAEASDLITVTTEPLAEIFREFNPNVAVLPNCLPPVAYADTSSRGAERKLRIGWCGGSSHGRDIHVATPAVRRFISRFPNWDLYLGGTDFRAAFKVPIDRVTHEGWHPMVEDEAEEALYYQALDNFDIGIAPLLDTKFAQSKSFLKCLEYGARGIPVVASDVTAYRNYIEHGYNGFLVKTEHEWLGALSELASDEQLRLNMGAAARETAGRYAIENNWQAWERAYEGPFK
jgi:glycosyltransferase involved in cell wall biosynthesis